jgi:3-hydroxy-9,10-secoandrosta-1,3,5(10)-triene-9,17-dione monooxygenase reductase component
MTQAAPAPAPTPPAPDARSFRDALGRFATGVAFVTAAPDGEPAGLIVNSLTSVSLEPPLVAFCPSRSSLTWSRMRRAGRFGVNVLARQHEQFAIRATPAGADRFAGLDWQPGRSGVPLLTHALATLECEIVAEHPTGDHWIVVARVDEVRISPSKDPLVFFAGEFGALQATVRPGRGLAESVPICEGGCRRAECRRRSPWTIAARAMRAGIDYRKRQTTSRREPSGGSDSPAPPLRQRAASRRSLPHSGEAVSGITGSLRGYSLGTGGRSLARDTAIGAMSRRVETIRRAHEALNSGDVDGLVAVCDSSFRLDMSDRVLNPAVYEGHEGIRQFVAEVHEAWETFTWEPEELVESGDLVLALIRSTGRGRGSGVELDRHAAMLWTVPAERAVSLRFFRDRDAARRAAGR